MEYKELKALSGIEQLDEGTITSGTKDALEKAITELKDKNIKSVNGMQDMVDDMVANINKIQQIYSAAKRHGGDTKALSNDLKKLESAFQALRKL